MKHEYILFSSFILEAPGDEEQVYRSYRRVTCREATARVVPPSPGTSEAFSQIRQAIGGTKGKAVVYKQKLSAIAALNILGQSFSHSGQIANPDFPF